MIKSLSGGLSLTDRTTQRGANKFRSPLFYIFYFFKYMIKANPSPNGNGFAFILSGDPNGIRTSQRVLKKLGKSLRFCGFFSPILPRKHKIYTIISAGFLAKTRSSRDYFLRLVINHSIKNFLVKNRHNGLLFC